MGNMDLAGVEVIPLLGTGGNVVRGAVVPFFRQELPGQGEP